MLEAWALLIVSVVVVFLIGGIAAYNEGVQAGRKQREQQEYEAGYAAALHAERKRQGAAPLYGTPHVATRPLSTWEEID